MSTDLSQDTYRPRVLIAENHTSTVDSLIATIGGNRLNFEYDLCSSHDHAVIKLFRSPSPYHLVISSVQLAEADDFLLIKHNRFLQQDVPFVITTDATDIKSSRRALKEGAFDVIATPLEAKQTVETLRLALWYSKLKALIHSREEASKKYGQVIADYLPDRTRNETFHSLLASVQEDNFFADRSIKRIEQSLARLADLATKVEHQARQRAAARLDALHKLAFRGRDGGHFNR